MDKIVQIKYARGLRYAKNKICLILGIDEEGTVILARSSSLSWKISKDLISHLVKCNFTSKESKKIKSYLWKIYRTWGYYLLCKIPYMDKLTSYDICTKYGCLSRIFTLITYFIMLFVVILLLNIIL